ncbi:hypothetical protein C8J56DRAFT_1157870 [Mycena floridula]|nr:hypothetical protein C8J56DRAFT_1157870 [Mycena floridula]
MQTRTARVPVGMACIASTSAGTGQRPYTGSRADDDHNNSDHHVFFRLAFGMSFPEESKIRRRTKHRVSGKISVIIFESSSRLKEKEPFNRDDFQDRCQSDWYIACIGRLDLFPTWANLKSHYLGSCNDKPSDPSVSESSANRAASLIPVGGSMDYRMDYRLTEARIASRIGRNLVAPSESVHSPQAN